MGKCNRCNKTVYEKEAARYGPPGKEEVVHKACFTCQNEGCTWKLDARSYYFCDGKTYCKAHNAMTGTGNAAHATGKFETTLEMQTSKDAPKQDVVRSNIVSPRGAAPSQTIDVVTATQMNAPKKDVERGVGVPVRK